MRLPDWLYVVVLLLMRKLLTLTLFSTVACVSPGKSDVIEPPMDGTIWILKHIGNTEITNSATQPFIKFENGSFQGFGGCNSFNGGYTKEKDRIRIRQITATKMFCEAIDTEQSFFSNLQRGTKFLIRTDKLIIADGDKPLLLFKAKKL